MQRKLTVLFITLVVMLAASCGAVEDEVRQRADEEIDRQRDRVEERVSEEIDERSTQIEGEVTNFLEEEQ